MELLGSLGINLKLLIAQIINFGLLLWLLTKFLYKPIIKRIEEDEETLQKAKTLSKQLELEKTEFEEQKKNDMANAKKKVEEIVKEASIIADAIKSQAQIEGEKEKQEVIKQIRSRLPESDK